MDLVSHLDLTKRCMFVRMHVFMHLDGLAVRAEVIAAAIGVSLGMRQSKGSPGSGRRAVYDDSQQASKQVSKQANGA